MVFVCFCYPLKTNKGSTITRKTFDFHLFKFRAEDGTQTRDPQLGRFKRFTYESNCYAFLYAECLFLNFVLRYYLCTVKEVYRSPRSTKGVLRGTLKNNSYFFFSRCDNALPATLLLSLPVRPSLRTFDAFVATDFDVVFFAISNTSFRLFFL